MYKNLPKPPYPFKTWQQFDEVYFGDQLQSISEMYFQEIIQSSDDELCERHQKIKYLKD